MILTYITDSRLVMATKQIFSHATTITHVATAPRTIVELWHFSINTERRGDSK